VEPRTHALVRLLRLVHATDTRAVAVAAALAGCAAPPQVQAPHADTIETPPPRRPDAVLLEPAPARPVPSSHADARGVVALRQPPGADAVAAVVSAWIDAWQRESLDALADLLSPDAVALDGQSRGHAALVDSLRQRLQAHDYGRLGGLDLVRSDRIERFMYDDFDASGAPPRPSEMQRDDLYVRVPLEVVRVAGERFFGDALVFVLRTDTNKLRIAAYGETDEK
jgi:hypothetical protein